MEYGMESNCKQSKFCLIVDSFEKCPLWYETICQENKVENEKLVVVYINNCDGWLAITWIFQM